MRLQAQQPPGLRLEGKALDIAAAAPISG